MASFEDFTNKIRELADTIDEIVLDEMDNAALFSISLLQRRLQEQSVDADGNPWRPYSESYKEYKAKEGKSGNGKVNFTFTGRMLTNIGIVAKTKGNTVTVRVRPRSEENQLKMKGLSYGVPAGGRPASQRKSKKGKTYEVGAYFHPGTQGRGRIMNLSAKEEESVKRIYMEGIFTRINAILR